MSGFCPNHGPYDEATCPFPPPHGDKERPGKPFLSDDEAPTDLGQGRRHGYNDSGEEPTEIPNGNGRFLDDGEELTDPGGYDDLDVTELDEPSRVTLAMLWVKEGRRRGKTYNVYNGMIVGRKGSGLVLDERNVSSIHAKFKMEGDNFVVWDLGSSNGTYVNGKKIREATILDENDLVKIGDTVFVVKLLTPRPKRKVAAPKSKKPVTKKLSKK
ncbi:MAG: FHA domain-containing protein [Chloroflexi bacterium]|nr:FHA domain-containing protein [Chloroflexota bacterium]